jgi:hypothetical protein
MKTNKIIYWVTTGLVSVMMLFSAYSYFSNPEVAAGFTHLGFPSYFRIELAIAKLIASIVLIVPQIPTRVKEWAYAGLGITFISAAIAHTVNGDPAKNIMMPIIFLVILIISNIYLYKQKKLSLAI